jgi:hypothetical protein
MVGPFRTWAREHASEAQEDVRPRSRSTRKRSLPQKSNYVEDKRHPIQIQEAAKSLMLTEVHILSRSSYGLI